MIFLSYLSLSGRGWNQDSPWIEDDVSVAANSTIHDYVEEEGYWAANEIGEAQNVVSDGCFCEGIPTFAGCRFNRLKNWLEFLIQFLIEFLIEKALKNYTKKIHEISSLYMYDIS